MAIFRFMRFVILRDLMCFIMNPLLHKTKFKTILMRILSLFLLVMCAVTVSNSQESSVAVNTENFEIEQVAERVISGSEAKSASEFHPILPFLKKDTHYQWPTNASDYLSATFGETRAAHFHAAVDIGTWGQRGYRVYATRDGVLSRVSITPTGYGNAVYLKHDDGSYSLYAHLQDFVPEIRTVVDSIRFQNYRFEFDQSLEHLNIKFNQGDLIAYTGDTGIGPPHLHFELRTPSNNPFNPLLVGISVPDNVPPRFASLSVEPISSDAAVNGRKHIGRIPIRGTGTVYSFNTFEIEGEVGLGVDVSDRADAMRNVYAVYELKLSINDSLFFHSRADSFEIRNSRMMLLDRVTPILRAERRGYQRMFIKNGNKTTFYKDVGYDGVLRLEPGEYEITIEASDYFGNTSTATGKVRVRESAANHISRTKPNQNILPIPEGNQGLPEYFNDLFWTNNWFANPDQRRLHDVNVSTIGSFTAEKFTGELQGKKFVDLRNDSPLIVGINEKNVVLHRVVPGSRSVLRTKDQRLQLEFRENTLYDTMSVAFAYLYEKDKVIIETGPNHEPLRSSYILRFLLTKEEMEQPNLGIYSVSRNGQNESYSLVGRQRNGQFIQGSTNSFNTFTILSDTTAPSITRPRIYQRNDGKWFASVRINDDLSGVDYASAQFYVNDVRGIAEYDPFGGLLIYHLPNFLPRRSNQLRVVLPDRMGNIAEETFTINRR